MMLKTFYHAIYKCCSVQRQMLIVWVNGWGTNKWKQHHTGIGHLRANLLSYWLVLTPLFLQRKKTLNLSQMSFIFDPAARQRKEKEQKVHETQEQYYFINLWKLSCSNKWMISTKSCSDQKTIQFWFCIH